MDGMEPIDDLMNQGVNENIFPGAVLLASKDNTVLFHRAYGYSNLTTRLKTNLNTIFDLASLTKPLATTLAVMALIQKGELSLDQPVGSILKPFNRSEKKAITIRHLLCHNSGLPDYRPYYLTLHALPFEKRKTELRRCLADESLVNAVGKKTVYSDLGFMILRWIIETVSHKALDYFTFHSIYQPLNLEGLFFPNPLISTTPHQFAATEKCPWRNMILQGQVHDENAWVMGGVEGHAGLFGTAIAINSLLWSMLNVFYDGSPVLFFEKDLLRVFFSRQVDSEYALGFDTPSGTNASCGRYFSSHSVGHLGFTGTSFWVDLDQAVVVILLSNRVHLSRENIKIREFRPRLHDRIMASLATH